MRQAQLRLFKVHRPRAVDAGPPGPFCMWGAASRSSAASKPFTTASKMLSAAFINAPHIKEGVKLFGQQRRSHKVCESRSFPLDLKMLTALTMNPPALSRSCRTRDFRASKSNACSRREVRAFGTLDIGRSTVYCRLTSYAQSPGKSLPQDRSLKILVTSPPTQLTTINDYSQ